MLRSLLMSRPAVCMLIAALTLPAGVAVYADDKPPIKVGAVSTITGPATFAEVSNTAKAYFDRVNAAGGIDGRKIEYTVEDDKFDPAASAQAAHRLIEDDGVVANVGGASIFDCAVNGPYYEQKGFVSVTGVGIDPQCFNTPNVSPVNTGPYVAFADMIYYVVKRYKTKSVCAVVDEGTNLAPGFKRVIPGLENAIHEKLTYVDYSHHSGDDPLPYILRAKSAGCQAVMMTGVGPVTIAWMKAVRAQGLIDKMKWLFLSPPYTSGVATALGSTSNGILAAAEFEPWSDTSTVLSDWRSLASANSIDPSAFSQAGYLAAKIFVDTLRTIKGPIDRDSVTAAFKKLAPVKTTFTGTPYTFGQASAHNSNRSVKIMTLTDGKWSEIDPAWVSLPASGT